MSKLKKRIILVCVVLAILLSCVAGLSAFAAETVPLPTGNARGLARMRMDIYEMYQAGQIDKETFEEYAAAFDIDTQMNAKAANSMWDHMVRVTKEKNSTGLSKASVYFDGDAVMEYRLYGSASTQEEMNKNLKLVQNFYLKMHPYWGGYYSWTYKNYMSGLELITDERVNYDYNYAVLNGKSRYTGAYVNGDFVWRVTTGGNATISDMSFYLMDYGNAGADGWNFTLRESDKVNADGSTIYQLVAKDPNGDLLRVANKQISYDDLATLQLLVTMQSTDTQTGGRTYQIPAKAVSIEYRKVYPQNDPSIIFEFYGDEWLEMEDQVVITDIKTVQIQPDNGEKASYDVFDIYSAQNLSDKFGLTSATPVTDFAGNEIIWEGAVTELTHRMEMDRKEAVVVGVEIDASNFTAIEGSGEADYKDAFSGPYDYIFASVVMNEELSFDADRMAAAKENVRIQWNLRDTNGNPVTSDLMFMYNSTDHKGIVYTTLHFESLHIKREYEPQGEQIVVEKILGEEYIFDRVGNNNLNNEVLMTGNKETSIWPDKITYLDTRGPEVTLQDVVVRSKTATDGKVESIQITVPFRVTDYNPGEGKMTSTASGTLGSMQLVNPVDGQAIQYRYTITYDTEFPESDASGVKWSKGNLGKTGHSNYATFGVSEENTNMYLHMELSNLADYEISEKDGLNMNLWIRDMVENITIVSKNIPIIGVDNVAPNLNLSSRKVRISDDRSAVTFSASVDANDTNGIHLIEYRFVDSEDDNTTAYESVYIKAEGDSYNEYIHKDISHQFAADDVINKILQIRSYDKNNNCALASMQFSADLSKVMSNYSFDADIFQPSDQSGIKIDVPIFNGNLSENAGTRLTVVTHELVDGILEDSIYFRVIPASQISEPVTALDPNSGDWYQVLTDPVTTGTGHYAYHSVVKVDGQPDWVNHYGDMDLYIASSNQNMLNIATNEEDNIQYLTLDPGYSNGTETDTTYFWEKIGTVPYTGDMDDVYTLSYDQDQTRIIFTDSTGEEITAHIKWEDPATYENELYRYAMFEQSISGTRVGVNLANEKFADWGVEGIDFENSYAVLVRADADGNVLKDSAGNYEEVTDRLPLSNSLEQILTVPDVATEGETFTSGVYTWVVHVAQKGGGESHFANADLYLILDNAEVPENFGVLSHTYQIYAAQGREGVGQYIKNVVTPSENQDVLSVINIGVAEPSELLYTYDGLETVEVDGFPSYFKGVTNSSETGYYNSTQFASFVITADTTDSGYGTYLEQEVGKVQGIRFWNKASSGDYRSVSYVEEGMDYRNQTVTGVMTTENGKSELKVSFNVGWYNEELTNSAIYSEEELKELDVKQFGLMLGKNTVCYQLMMENGKESPIYQLTLNLVDQAPQVNVDVEFGPYYTVDRYEMTGWDADGYIFEHKLYRNAEYVEYYFGDMFSEYSGLKVYYAAFVPEQDYESAHYDIQELTDDEINNGFRLYEASGCLDQSASYSDKFQYGFSGTYITSNNYSGGSEHFFIVTDNSGNAITIYPIDNADMGQSLEYFVPVSEEYGSDYYDEYNYLTFYNEDGGYAELNYNSYIDIRVDAPATATAEELEDLWVTYDVSGECLPLPNASGFAGVYGSDILFATKYDTSVAEGAMVKHSMDIRVRGELDSVGNPNYTKEWTVEFEAPNVKPAIKEISGKAGCIEIVYTVPVITDKGAAFKDYLPYGDDVVAGEILSHTYTDLFGNSYTEEFTVPAEAEDPVVTYSTTEYTDDVVVVTIESPTAPLKVSSNENLKHLTQELNNGYNYGLYFNEIYQSYYSDYEELYCTYEVDEYGDIISDSFVYYLDPSCKIKVEEGYDDAKSVYTLVLTADANFQTDVYFDSYENEGYAAYIEVNNVIQTSVVDPYISWDYHQGDVKDGVVYGNVTAHLVDRNGQILVDPNTGTTAKFTFYPGGPTEYTFSGCYSHATETAVPDITAKLAVTLKPEPIEEKDTMAPDVDVVAYLTNATGSKPAFMVYRHSTDRFMMNNYAFEYSLPESEIYYDDINDMIANMGWSKSYMFHLDVYDESRVKLILSEEIKESGITYNTASDKIEGIELVGRTLQVNDNCEFALYIVDEENNITGLYIQVGNLAGAPVPELALVESRTAAGEPAIRVYLLPPQVNGYEDLEITNTEKQTDFEQYGEIQSDYYGLDYMLYDESGNYNIYYSYMVPEIDTEPFTGTLVAEVDVPVLTVPAVKHPVWSANYYNKFTNQDVTLHLKLNVPVKSATVVYTTESGTDYRVANNVINEAGLYVSAFQDDVAIVYEKNIQGLLDELKAQLGEGKLRIQMTELKYGAVGYYDVPAVSHIDRDAPALSGEVQIDYPEMDYKTAVITLNLNETALTKDGRQKGTQFRYTVRENDTYTYSFLDEAGNLASFDVEVRDLITEPLKITLSVSASDSGIIEDPSTFRTDVGDTLYAKTNRDSTIYIYGEGTEETKTVAKDTWTAVTVTENSMGMHPSVIARDNYGNVAIVQLEYIPIKDITAPAAFLHRDTVSVSATATEAQIYDALIGNILYSDDTTAMDDLTVTVEYDKVTSGRTVVTYTITDAEGNETIRQCYLRIRSGLEPVIHVNGQLVEDGAFIYVTDVNDLDISVEYDGDVAEPYKLVYEEGDLRSWAKMKDGNWLTAGYEDAVSQTYKIEDLGNGWYSFALTTQGMEVYYFQIHVGQA